MTHRSTRGGATEEAPHIGIAAGEPRPRADSRWRIIPVAYPALISLAYALAFLVASGASPYAAGRPLLAAVSIGLGLSWLLGVLCADRHRGGLVALIVLLVLLFGDQLAMSIAAAVVLGVLALESRNARRKAGIIRWALVTRAATALAVVLLLAVGIKAVQDGRAVELAEDLAAEAPAPRRPMPPPMEGVTRLPDIYLVLLDGYPRADKLMTEFGIDGGPFIEGLRDRGLTAAEQSRSNYVATRMTLASMLNGEQLDALFGSVVPSPWHWRKAISGGQMLEEFRDAGYQVVSISSGYEVVSIRRADVFIDSGQLNEFEYVFLKMTAVGRALMASAPDLFAADRRARIDQSLDAVVTLAEHPIDRPRVVLLHLSAPHSPLLYDENGGPAPPVSGTGMFGIGNEESVLGTTEYARRYAGQISVMAEKTLDLIDAVDARLQHRPVFVVFSDHGLDIRGSTVAGPDLRTANLLAVRAPAHDDIIDRRSTLINLLPRLLRAYTGMGPADAPEDIKLWGDAGYEGSYDRPD